MKEHLREQIGRMYRAHVARYSIVSLDPPIFYVQLELNPTDDFIAAYQVLFSFLRGRKAYCLCCYSWNVTPQVLNRVTELESRCKLQFLDIQLIHLCNEAGQAELFHARGASRQGGRRGIDRAQSGSRRHPRYHADKGEGSSPDLRRIGAGYLSPTWCCEDLRE